MINKNLMLVAMLSMGTALTTLGKVKPTLASLTPPATYVYSYTWNATASEQYLNVNGVDSIPLYTRTADGAHYNYTSNFEVIQSLDVTMTFNRSNTTWQSSGTSWKPDQSAIGSDSSVGSLRKYNFIFSNYTNNDYRLYLDMSTKGTYSGTRFEIFINTYEYWTYDNYVLTFPLGSFFTIPVLAGTVISIQHIVYAESEYFDAWYLQDLGISDAYQAGYDANRGGILTDYLGTDAQQIGWVLLGIAAILFVFKGGK